MADTRQSNSAQDAEDNPDVGRIWDATSTQENVHSFYDDWAELYEKDFELAQYNGHYYAAEGLANFITEKRDSVRIIDIAAGTGLVGEHLVKLGFLNLDALDPSSKILEVAKRKDIYTNLICALVNDQRLDIPDDTYDGVVISGGTGIGHMPAVALYEILRILKPGGGFCMVSNAKRFDSMDEYNTRMRDIMNAFEMEGKWVKLAEERLGRFYFMENNWCPCYRFSYRKI